MTLRKTALGADLVIPLLALGFATYFFSSIEDLAWEAKANGMIIGSVLVLLILVQVGRIAARVVRGHATLGFDALFHPRELFLRRLGLVAITVVFMVTLPWLGLTLGLLVHMAAALYLVGVRRPAVLAAVSGAVAASVYILFIAVLDSSFPHGPVENVLAPLVR